MNYTLVVIPSDPLSDYVEKGIEMKLAGLYNPAGFFSRVFCLSPFESRERQAYGMTVIPTKDAELPRRLKTLKVDVLRAYGGYWPADMACYYRCDRVPVIVSVHDKRSDWLSSSLKYADAVFVVSQELKGILARRGVVPERIFVVPNGVDMNLMRPLDWDRSAWRERFPYKYCILNVGRKSFEKNIDTIIKSLVSLGEDYCLISVGQGNASVYENQARAAGVLHRCFFLPAVTQEELVYFYNGADVLCQPSRSEAMSNVLLEGMACGVPLVISASAAAGIEARHGFDAIVVDDPENPGLISEGIHAVCEQAGLKKGIRERARNRVARFSLDAMRDLEAECYRRILQDREKDVYRLSRRKAFVLWHGNLCRRIMKRMPGFQQRGKCAG